MNINHHSDYRPEIGSGKPIKLPPKRDWSKTTTFGGVSWSPECFRDRSRPFPTYFEHDAQRAFAEPLTELLGVRVKSTPWPHPSFYSSSWSLSGCCYKRIGARCASGWDGFVVVEPLLVEAHARAEKAAKDAAARSDRPAKIAVAELPVSWSWLTPTGVGQALIGDPDAFPGLTRIASCAIAISEPLKSSA
jgi:hypothetical protein